MEIVTKEVIEEKLRQVKPNNLRMFVARSGNSGGICGYETDDGVLMCSDSKCPSWCFQRRKWWTSNSDTKK